MSIRPDWRSIRRPDPLARPRAVAAVGGPCDCGRDVEPHEPIVCVGSQVVEEPDGRRHVDLSGAEWRCMHCIGVST